MTKTIGFLEISTGVILLTIFFYLINIDVRTSLRVSSLTHSRDLEVNDHACKSPVTLKFVVLELIIFRKQTQNLTSWVALLEFIYCILNSLDLHYQLWFKFILWLQAQVLVRKKKNSASYVVSSLMAVSAVVFYLIAPHFPI